MYSRDFNHKTLKINNKKNDKKNVYHLAAFPSLPNHGCSFYLPDFSGTQIGVLNFFLLPVLIVFKDF